jgi:hypothetical protein
MTKGIDIFRQSAAALRNGKNWAIIQHNQEIEKAEGIGICSKTWKTPFIPP